MIRTEAINLEYYAAIKPFAGGVEGCISDRITMTGGLIPIGDVLTTFIIKIVNDIAAIDVEKSIPDFAVAFGG
jgi:hypothetical protein